MTARQLSLFDGSEPEPVHNSSAGSRRAAKAIAPKRLTQRERILEFIRERGRIGSTRDEIAYMLDIPIQSVCARCSELFGNPVIDGRFTRPVLIKPASFTRENTSGIAVEVLVVV